MGRSFPDLSTEAVHQASSWTARPVYSSLDSSSSLSSWPVPERRAMTTVSPRRLNLPELSEMLRLMLEEGERRQEEIGKRRKERKGKGRKQKEEEKQGETGTGN